MSERTTQETNLSIDKENDEVVIGGTSVALRGPDGRKLTIDHVSEADGYVAFAETNHSLTFEELAPEEDEQEGYFDGSEWHGDLTTEVPVGEGARIADCGDIGTIEEVYEATDGPVVEEYGTSMEVAVVDWDDRGGENEDGTTEYPANELDLGIVDGTIKVEI